jgi:hypothetical protein
MPLNLNKSIRSLIFIAGVLVSSCSIAYIPLSCPQYVKVHLGKVKETQGWNSFIDMKFTNEHGDIAYGEAELKSESSIPLIGVMNSKTGAPTSITPDDSIEGKNGSEFIWNLADIKRLKDNNKPVFMCRAYGDSSQIPRKFIIIYYSISSELNLCALKMDEHGVRISLTCS